MTSELKRARSCPSSPHHASTAASSFPRPSCTAATLCSTDPNPSARAVASRSSGNGTPYPAALPSGDRSTRAHKRGKRLQGIEQPLGVCRGPEPDGRRHRLPGMGVPGPELVAMARGKGKERLRHVLGGLVQLQQLVLQVEPEVARHLVVARPTGMQLLADDSVPPGDPVLHGAVRVLMDEIDHEHSCLDLPERAAERCPELPVRVRRQELRCAQSFHVSQAPVHVPGKEAHVPEPVLANRVVEHQAIRVVGGRPERSRRRATRGHCRYSPARSA